MEAKQEAQLVTQVRRRKGEAQKVEENKRWGDKRKGEREIQTQVKNRRICILNTNIRQLPVVACYWLALREQLRVECFALWVVRKWKALLISFPEMSCTADFRWVTSRYYTVTECMSSLTWWLIVILFWKPIDMRNIFILSGSLGTIISVWGRQQRPNEHSITVPSRHQLQPTQNNRSSILITPGYVITHKVNNIKGIALSLSSLGASSTQEMTLWNGLDLRPIKNELLEMRADPYWTGCQWSH